MTALLRIICATLALSTAQVQAESPAPFPEFKAKRIKPPSNGSRLPRINVQIDPAATIVAAVPSSVISNAPAAPIDEVPKATRYGWFWEKVSPALATSDDSRFELAMSVLSGATRPVAAPRLQHLQDIARARGIDILTHTIGTDVSPALVLAVIAVESAGEADAVSAAGAQGLMQLMPATAARFGVKDSLIASDNIRGGVQYLDWLMKEFGSDPVLALAGYNAGEGAVRKHEGVPPYSETRDYVPKVLAAFQVARGLCMTPPQLASDGCVFAAMN